MDNIPQININKNYFIKIVPIYRLQYKMSKISKKYNVKL